MPARPRDRPSPVVGPGSIDYEPGSGPAAYTVHVITADGATVEVHLVRAYHPLATPIPECDSATDH